jgi:hypothetical protein
MQTLEPRQLMAGDVSVDITGDLLSITGDQYANDIVVATSGNDVIITPRGTTTVNGDNEPVRMRQLPGRSDVEIHLGSGGDRLELTTQAQSATGRKTHAQLQFNVDAGPGTDRVTVDGFDTFYGVTIDTGSSSRWGRDEVQINDSDIAILQVGSTRGSFHAELANVQANYLSIQRVGRLQVVDVEVGARPQNLQYPYRNGVPIEDRARFAELTAVYQTEGWGVVDIQGYSKLSSELEIGDRNYPIAEGAMYGKQVEIGNFANASIQSGSGGNWRIKSVDTLNAERLDPSSLAVSYVKHVDVADSSVGHLRIEASPDVNLHGVVTRRDLSILGSSQYNAIHIENSHIGRDLVIATHATRDTISIQDSTVSDDALFDTGAGSDLVSISNLTVRDTLFADLGEGRDVLEISSSSARRVWLDGGSDAAAKRQSRDRLSMGDNRFGKSRTLRVYQNWETLQEF